MRYHNTNDKFGMGGPFDAESREALADEMAEQFQIWSAETGQPADDIRAEFIEGLAEIG
ncbi:MAG: hypothetical protein GY854_30240 [Deltaproteobacteria bacterium]|nr:hypothetical protein [Deltaproteobacteria bacterium]